MDRSSQEPGPPSESPESPLSFPVEAPRLEGVEPGGGAPFSATEAASPDPLVFPAEPTPPPVASAPADPLAFPGEVPRPEPAFSSEAGSAPAGPLAFPVEIAALPATPPAFPAEAASAPADPLAFPVEIAAPPAVPAGSAPAAPPANPLAFPTNATRPPGRTPAAEALPFPVAQLPGVPASVSQPVQPAQLPADGTPEPPPIPVTEPGPGPARFLAPVLTTIAALLAVGGSFLPLFRLQQPVSVRERYFDAQLTVTETVWGNRLDIPGRESIDQAASPVGIPLVVAIVVLFAAALVAFSRPDRRLGRWLIGAGAVFTAGVVSTIGMSGLGWSAMADGNDLEVITSVGMWLLIGATVLAAAAAVVAHLPAWRRGRADDWSDPDLAYADTPTPPTGVAITVLPPDPDEQRE